MPRYYATVIGHFGNGKNLINGQTVKTKIITEELERQLGSDKISRIDTHGGIKTLFKAPLQIFKALKESKNVIIFPAHNGLRINAPLLSLERYFFKGRKLHYVVIGGWLPEFIENRKSLSRNLKKFDGIYVETNTMKAALEKQGFSNVTVMPNCKDLKILSEDELVYPNDIPYKLCTFSRVMKEKGIEDAVNAVKEINEEFGKTVYTLDIYGQVDSNQTEWFENLKSQFPEYIKYGGVISFDKSTDVLKDYFALLFPTYYEGEGFAGTLIDAMAAGVPVIASDWRYNSEIVKPDIGFTYSLELQSGLIEILKSIAAKPDLILSKKQSCLKEIDKYKIDNVVKTLVLHLDGKSNC